MQDIYVGTTQQAQFLQNSLSANLNGQPRPRIMVVPHNGKVTEEHVSFVAVKPPAANLARYVLMYRPSRGVKLCFEDIVAQQDRQPRQEIVIEAEVTSTPQSGLIMQDLAIEKWTLSGWLPSAKLLGGVCLLMTHHNK